jgi:NADH:ubiquinone oxidoreductase subunit 6 (subunit J)
MVSGLIEWVLFLGLSMIAVGMAAAMLLTMSMYRAGLALMSSFVALAGLFILLDADLLAAIQVMMNVGGMLVMILFMVMIMMDPGGEMMWDMKRQMRLPGPGAFSMSMPRGRPPQAGQDEGKREAAGPRDWTCPMHPEVSAPGPGTCPKCGMPLVPRTELQGDQSSADHHQTYTCPMHPEVRQDHPGQCPTCGMNLQAAEKTERQASQQHTAEAHAGMDTGQADSGKPRMSMAGMNPHQHYQMMVDMAMSTAQLPWALAMGAASALGLIVLLVQTPWSLAQMGPSQDATVAVGELLLSRYMIGFEGAAFLILAGMVGAVIFAKRERTLAPQKAAATPSAEAEIYTCPMHPEIRQPGPGQCPICGMNLAPAEQPVTHSPAGNGGAL